MTGCASKQEIRDRVAAALEGRGGYARLTLTGELAPDVDLHAVDFDDLPNSLDSPPIVRLDSVTVAYDLARIGQEPTVRGQFVRDVQASQLSPAGTSTRHRHRASRTRRARRSWKCSDVRIESVTAVAFGPFRDVTLEFAPQLTVIYGPNEAGKSSWHAAIYAALCGMRRARGQPRWQDRDFTDRHRPWSGDSWEVRAVVRLDDGRRVELRQNLSDLAHCSATDADFGRDVSGEILNEGTPDAAKWLGLDRESFLSVACVRQAEVQGVVDDATSLQDELQRAAASAARDATAAEAIARMEDFQRENVGQDRAHSTKPLQRAKMRLAAAETALTNAREKHASWLTIEARALALRKKASEEERRLRMFHALRARKDAERWRAKLERARELAAKYPGGQPGPLPDDETLAGDVAAALSEWENRPEVPVLAGESAASIRAEIDGLPSMPMGDQMPAAEILDARRAYERVTQALDLHEEQRPSEIQVSDAKGLTPDQLRELARALDTPIPSIDPQREADYAEARSRLAAAEGSSVSRPLVAGLAVAAVLGGAGLWAFGNPLIGSALVISGVTALVWLIFRSGEAGRTRALEKLRAVEAQVLSQRQAVEDATEKVKTARAQIAKLALPADSKGLREPCRRTRPCGRTSAGRSRMVQESRSTSFPSGCSEPGA